MPSEQSETRDDEPTMVECLECGNEMDEDEAIYSSGSVKKDGLERLLIEEESVPASELFGFDDGPYCSITCSMEDDDE